MSYQHLWRWTCPSKQDVRASPECGWVQEGWVGLVGAKAGANGRKSAQREGRQCQPEG